MIKKTFFLGAGLVLVLGLLFGRNLIPYSKTVYTDAQTWVNDQIDTSWQIDAARDQLSRVKDEIKPMIHQIAIEEVAIGRLSDQLQTQEQTLAKAESYILRLRDHLASGDTAYVSYGVNYTNTQVQRDLASHFEQFKTMQSSFGTTTKTLRLRTDGLREAKQNLRETIVQRRELELQIENLDARNKMMEVAKTTSQFSFDNSELSQARSMIDEIKTKMDVEAEMMMLLPQYIGEIPMEDGSQVPEADVVDAVDAYFGLDVKATSNNVALK